MGSYYNLDCVRSENRRWGWGPKDLLHNLDRLCYGAYSEALTVASHQRSSVGLSPLRGWGQIGWQSADIATSAAMAAMVAVCHTIFHLTRTTAAALPLLWCVITPASLV